MVICAWESTAEFHSLKHASAVEIWMERCNTNRHQLTVWYMIKHALKKTQDVIKHLFADNHVHVFHFQNVVNAATELKSTVSMNTSKIKKERLINLFKKQSISQFTDSANSSEVILDESWIRCKLFTNNSYAYSYLSCNLYLPKSHTPLRDNSEHGPGCFGFCFLNQPWL